jgi:hypothetical protein
MRLPCHPKATAALLLLGLAGCTDLGAPLPPPPPPPVPSAAFDGDYRGTVRVLGASTSMNTADCAVDSQLRFTVQDGRFGFVLKNLAAGKTPSLRDVQSQTYAGAVFADGSMTGRSEATGATMKGQVTGQRMTGEVYGLLCYYSFTADRR